MLNKILFEILSDERWVLMQIKPVKNYKTPSYPTKEEFLSQKNSLQNNLPKRWLNNKVVAGALAFLFLGNNTNSISVIPKPKLNSISIDSNKSKNPNIGKQNLDEKIPSIAPLFIYGDGRGASGCVVINPPVFMSEVDARQIIESTLMKEGIIFDKKNYKIEGLFFEEKNYWDELYSESDSDDLGYSKKNRDTVEVDAYSSELNLAYEFVSVDDYFKFGGKSDGSTVQGYDVVEAAENLRKKMKEYGKLNTVIFYDPMANPERENSKNESYESLKSWDYGFNRDKNEEPRFEYFTAKNNESVELLKKQISDFIEWIKQEGLLTKK